MLLVHIHSVETHLQRERGRNIEEVVVCVCVLSLTLQRMFRIACRVYHSKWGKQRSKFRAFWRCDTALRTKPIPRKPSPSHPPPTVADMQSPSHPHPPSPTICMVRNKKKIEKRTRAPTHHVLVVAARQEVDLELELGQRRAFAVEREHLNGDLNGKKQIKAIHMRNPSPPRSFFLTAAFFLSNRRVLSF
jgi:hypothetical protein